MPGFYWRLNWLAIKFYRFIYITALKAVDGSFKLNTDWRLSRFGDHSGAGTLFTYNRNKGSDCPGECITADGPTNVDLEVVVSVGNDW